LLGRTWVFKGGTCLRKCYYETFRFSEDLDFTVMPGGPDEPDDLRQAFTQIAEWLREESGIELTVDATAFRRRQNKRGRPTTQGRIAYRGPNPQHMLPKVKLDITADEVLVGRPILRPIGHPYGDAPLPRGRVLCFDVWSFYAARSDGPFPYRWRGTADFGPSKFGRYPGDPSSFTGRRVDLLGRSLDVPPGADPVTTLREYLSAARTASARALAAKAVVLIHPGQLAGMVVWQSSPSD